MAAFFGWKHRGQMLLPNLALAVGMYVVLTVNLSFFDPIPRSWGTGLDCGGDGHRHLRGLG